MIKKGCTVTQSAISPFNILCRVINYVGFSKCIGTIVEWVAIERVLNVRMHGVTAVLRGGQGGFVMALAGG